MSDVKTPNAHVSGQDIPASASEADKKLHKALTFWDLLFMSMGGIIGSGWLFAVNAAAATAGPSVILSWVVGGILLIFVALAYAEVSGMIPRTGGIVRYPHYSHGSYTGFFLGWAYLLSAVTVPAIEAEAVVGYAATYIPGLQYVQQTLFGKVNVLTPVGIAFALVLLVLFFMLNYLGIKVLGKTNTVVTAWKFALPILTFLFLFVVFKASNITSLPGGFAPYGLSPMFLAIPTTGIVFSYLGFRQALEYGGEAKNPQRDVPRALIFSVVLAMVIYTLLQLAFTGAVNFAGVKLSAGDWANLTNSAYASGPLYTALQLSGIGALAAFGYVLLADAYISPSGTGWIYSGTGVRTFYGLATDGYFPRALMRVNARGVPIFSLIAAFVVGVLFLLPFPSWYLLVGFISSATVFTYIMGGVSLTVFRKTMKSMARPFKLPAAAVIAPVSFIAASLIVYWSGFSLLFFVFTAILAGLPLYYIFYGPKGLGISRAKSVALGIVFWIGLLAVSYLGYTNLVAYYAANVSSSGTITASQGSFIQNSFYQYMVGLAALLIVFTFLIQALAVKESKQQIRSGWWLVIFSLAILTLSFFGAFGLLPVNGVTPIAFPYDTIAMVVVGVVFYYLAVFSGYKTEDAEDILRESGVPEPAQPAAPTA